MKYKLHSHRHADTVLSEKKYNSKWLELRDALDNISDEDIRIKFKESSNKMSISAAINSLIDDRLTSKKWLRQAAIFQDSEYDGKSERKWRLDFAKGPISIEVAFNHGEAMAWNLLKPVLASELNHVRKAIQTEIGVIILATDAMKKAGAFDSAVGSYEKALKYLKPMNDFLTVPILIIGLLPPETFVIKTEKVNYKNIGHIQMLK